MTELDPERTYSAAEQQVLTERLLEITHQVHEGALSDRRLDVALLRALHAALFGTVRGHAGKVRENGFGQEYLNFGPNRSVHRGDVVEELDEVSLRVRRELADLDPETGDYELRAIRVAVLAHADVVWIHPFEDGNGRTSRLLAGVLLVRCGLKPVAIETVKQEYTDALNVYFASERTNAEPIVDLYIDRYALGAESDGYTDTPTR